MSPKAQSVAILEQFSHRVIESQGFEAYAEVGMAVMSLARSQALRERYLIAHSTDISTRQPIALWQRRLADGDHTVATSSWGQRSYLMQDLRQPSERNAGFLRLYLFGNDASVKGLARAHSVIKIDNLAQVPLRDELEQRVYSYIHHPTQNRLITAQDGVSTFIRLVKSILMRS